MKLTFSLQFADSGTTRQFWPAGPAVSGATDGKAAVISSTASVRCREGHGSPAVALAGAATPTPPSRETRFDRCPIQGITS